MFYNINIIILLTPQMYIVVIILWIHLNGFSWIKILTIEILPANILDMFILYYNNIYNIIYMILI